MECLQLTELHKSEGLVLSACYVVLMWSLLFWGLTSVDNVTNHRDCLTYCCYAGSPWSDWFSGSWWPVSWLMPCPADRYCRCIVGSAPPAPRKSPFPARDGSGPHHATSPSSSPNSWKYFKISIAIIRSLQEKKRYTSPSKPRVITMISFHINQKPNFKIILFEMKNKMICNMQ